MSKRRDCLKEEMQRWFRALGILSLTLWLGASTWFAFIQSPLLFRDVPGIAPVLQELLFPRYWALGYITLGLASLLFLVRALFLVDPSLFFKAVALGIMLILLAVIQFHISPHVQVLGDQLIQAGASPSPEIKKAFGKWHGSAMSLNLMVYLGVLIIVWTELFSKREK